MKELQRGVTIIQWVDGGDYFSLETTSDYVIKILEESGIPPIQYDARRNHATYWLPQKWLRLRTMRGLLKLARFTKSYSTTTHEGMASYEKRPNLRLIKNDLTEVKKCDIVYKKGDEK